MQKGNKIWMLALVLGLAGFGAGCDDDNDDNNPIGPGDNTETAQVDATSGTDWTFFSLELDEAVDLTPEQALASSNWHLSFQRFGVRLNSGSFGALAMEAVDLEEAGIADGSDFEAIDAVPAELTTEDWSGNTERLVFDGWYNYNPVTHEVTPSGRAFAVKDAGGNGFAKVEVTEIVTEGMGVGSLTLRYVYDPDGTDLSGTEQTVTLTGGENFFSFADGVISDPADPAASTDWDLWFSGFDVRSNSGISGPGMAGVYPAWDDPDFDTWAELSVAPPNAGGSYEMDSVSNVFDSWYTYNGQTHELTTNGHVYLLRSGETVWKFQITNYYKVIEGSPVPGWISFKYEEL